MLTTGGGFVALRTSAFILPFNLPGRREQSTASPRGLGLLPLLRSRGRQGCTAQSRVLAMIRVLAPTGPFLCPAPVTGQDVAQVRQNDVGTGMVWPPRWRPCPKLHRQLPARPPGGPLLVMSTSSPTFVPVILLCHQAHFLVFPIRPHLLRMGPKSDIAVAEV